jgi:hypothetical protein
LRPPDLPQSVGGIIFTAGWMRNVTWRDIASASGQRQQFRMQVAELYEKLFRVLLTYGTEQQHFPNFCFISFQRTTTINKGNFSSHFF